MVWNISFRKISESILMFIATLFTISKKRKRPKCPSTDEWIKKVIYPYNRILFSLEKEEHSDPCHTMNEP